MFKSHIALPQNQAAKKAKGMAVFFGTAIGFHGIMLFAWNMFFYTSSQKPSIMSALIFFLTFFTLPYIAAAKLKNIFLEQK